jgi:TRAP transporter TAXI family solute receptor
VLALAVVTASRAAPGITFVNLGSSQSLYYDIGRALCSVVDLTRKEHGIRCSVQSTPGSVYNLEHLVPWDLDFALVQSDAHYVAYRGEGNWQGRPFTRLRSVMSLYPEVLTLMAPTALGTSAVGYLKGRRVNIGPPGSGTRATWDNLQSELKWSEADLKRAVEMRPDRAGESLCSGKLDGNLLMVGHPSPIVKADLAGCPLSLVPIQGPEVERLVANRPYYTLDSIKGSVYGLTNDVPTFGARATLVTTADTPESVVYAMTKALLEELDVLRAAHPALAFLEPTRMATAALTAPLHPGAERAFREHGVLLGQDRGAR